MATPELCKGAFRNGGCESGIEVAIEERAQAVPRRQLKQRKPIRLTSKQAVDPFTLGSSETEPGA